MTKYNTFLFIFLLGVISFIVFFVFYVHAIFGFSFGIESLKHHHNPIGTFRRLFSPEVVISGAIMTFLSLAYRILGIVYLAKNKTVGDGEKALWILGFVLMGFVTAIVFLVMARGRKFA